MRHAAGLALGLALTGYVSVAHAMVGLPGAVAPSAPALTKVEYFCSPGFRPSYGGTCIAVPSRAEIELFVDQPIYAPVAPAYRPVVRHHRHRVLRERY